MILNGLFKKYTDEESLKYEEGLLEQKYPDFKNLIVFTDQTLSGVQSNILDRTQWALTPGFQSVIYPAIGCAAGKSIVNQYGVTWWFSHGGFISIDQAVQTYRSSRTHFQDQAMTSDAKTLRAAFQFSFRRIKGR